MTTGTRDRALPPRAAPRRRSAVLTGLVARETLRDGRLLLLVLGLPPALVALLVLLVLLVVPRAAGGALADPAAFLAPAVLPLGLLLLALPGTAGTLVDWRSTGLLRLLGTAGGGADGLLRALLTVRAALAVLPALTAVGLCAATGVLRAGVDDLPALVLTAVLGTAALLTGGLLTGGLLVLALARSAVDSCVLLRAAAVVGAVLGGFLLPFRAVPGPAAAALGWTPTAVLADAWRAVLTGAVPAHPVPVSWAVLAGTALVCAVATARVWRRAVAPRA